jgi:hypothetical protein
MNETKYTLKQGLVIVGVLVLVGGLLWWNSYGKTKSHNSTDQISSAIAKESAKTVVS